MGYSRDELKVVKVSDAIGSSVSNNETDSGSLADAYIIASSIVFIQKVAGDGSSWLCLLKLPIWRQPLVRLAAADRYARGCDDNR